MGAARAVVVRRRKSKARSFWRDGMVAARRWVGQVGGRKMGDGLEIDTIFPFIAKRRELRKLKR